MRKFTGAMLRNSFCILLLLFADVLCHPSLEVPGENGTSVVPLEVGSTFSDDTPQGSTRVVQRVENLAKLQRLLGISKFTQKSRLHVILPQFMTDLYDIVADSDGANLREYPHKAEIVRSIIEKDSSLSHHYAFNFTGLETSESLLAAELHLHLKETSLATIHPAGLLSPYSMIRVYQVLDEHRLDIPDSHALLTVHRVAADASEWQVLDVKKAVLSWMSGAPNLGFLVTVSNSLGGGAAVHFSRGTEHDGKRPILVLFTDDGVKTTADRNPVPARRHEYEDDLDAEDEEDTVRNSGPEGDGIKRQKRKATSSENGDSTRVWTSMDVYKWALKREKLTRSGNTENAETLETVRPQRRSRSTPKIFTITAPTPDTSECARHELYVNFEEIGWKDWVVAPNGYQAYQCKGHCNLLLNKNLTSTNHAQVQNLVYSMTGADYTNAPCCVPTELRSISMLYLDETNEVILKNFQNMVAEKCGCR